MRSLKGKKVYIAGKISGLDRAEVVRKFATAERSLREAGAITFNPTILPPGFEWEEYMTISTTAMRCCDVVYALADWGQSNGAEREVAMAVMMGMPVILENERKVGK